MGQKTQTRSLAVQDETPFIAIEELSNEYTDVLAKSKNDFLRMVVTAKAFKAMRELLTDDIVKVAKYLENSKLGFKTDKKQGYDISTIRDCLIEAHLNGVRVVGNEFNIMSGQMYITKEGFIGKMQRSPDFSAIKLNIGVPRINQAEERAIVPCSATWEYFGQPDTIECEIPIKWNSYTSDDALIGKAERKLRARIWNQSTGDVVSEGDADGYVNETRVANAVDITDEQSHQQEEQPISRQDSLLEKLGKE